MHLGRQIAGVRQFRRMKQEVLADALQVSQQAVSKIEQSEHVEDATLERIAKALGVSVDVIKNYDEEKTIMNIQNNYEGANRSSGTLNQNAHYHECSFNPLDKLMEALEENKKLYEALLKEKEERIKLLEGKK